MRTSLIDESSAIEPLSLNDVKLQVRLPVDEPHPEDSYLEDLLIPAVRQHAELLTRRSLRQGVWELAIDHGWLTDDPWLELPRPPVIEVLSVSYLDAGGVLQTLVEGTDYVVDLPAGPFARRARIAPAHGVSWPLTRGIVNSVLVRFLAGYSPEPFPVVGTPLPPLLRAAMLADVATRFEFREDAVQGTSIQPRDEVVRVYRQFKSWPTTNRRDE